MKNRTYTESSSAKNVVRGTNWKLCYWLAIKPDAVRIPLATPALNNVPAIFPIIDFGIQLIWDRGVLTRDLCRSENRRTSGHVEYCSASTARNKKAAYMSDVSFFPNLETNI